MRRVFLGVGDKAGDAVITEGLPSVTCSNPPPLTHIATLFMKTWCNACKQEGYIAPTGPRHEGTGPNGQRWALSGDLNICGCSPPPVFHAERNMAMIFTSEEAVSHARTAVATSTRTIADGTFDQYFRLIDERTGKSLEGAPYRIVTPDGEELEGHTDAQGHTLRVSCDWAVYATLHVLENVTPINPHWDQ